MCHNLGADYSLDPFTPSADIHGDKYQWGHKNPVVKQKDDKYTGTFPNWPTERTGNTWNNVVDDPCPKRYRVPTETEWENIIEYNTFTKIGNWTSVTGKKADTGVKIGDNLFLPTAGATDQFGNTDFDFGDRSTNSSHASYWSSRNSLAFAVYGTEKKITVRDLLDGNHVRCIRLQ